MCVGDIHNINAEIQKFDPNYFLDLNPHVGKYQIFERRTQPVREGVYQGRPLFSFQEVCDVVMTIDYINPEKEAPDMRILRDLRQKDVWNYPGGPKAFYDDMMRDSERIQQKREDRFNENVRFAAEEQHKYIVREHDGAPDLKTLY